MKKVLIPPLLEAKFLQKDPHSPRNSGREAQLRPKLGGRALRLCRRCRSRGTCCGGGGCGRSRGAAGGAGAGGGFDIARVQLAAVGVAEFGARVGGVALLEGALAFERRERLRVLRDTERAGAVRAGAGVVQCRLFNWGGK